MQFAMKAPAIRISKQWSDVFKEPVTDSGKRSKRGRLALIPDEASIKTVRESELQGRENLLRPVFRNGKILVSEDFDTIRRRSFSTNV